MNNAQCSNAQLWSAPGWTLVIPALGIDWSLGLAHCSFNSRRRPTPQNPNALPFLPAPGRTIGANERPSAPADDPRGDGGGGVVRAGMAPRTRKAPAVAQRPVPGVRLRPAREQG